MQGIDLPMAQRRGLLQQLPAAFNLGDSRQKHEHSAASWQREGMVLQGPQHLSRQFFLLTGSLMNRLNRMGAPFAGEHHSLRQPLPQIREVQGGGHHHHSQFRMQKGCGFPEQGEGQVAVTPPFVELIEQHATHAIERWIRLQASQEQPIGDHLQLGVGRPKLLSTHSESHPLPYGLSKGCGQPFCCCTGGQPSRLDHPDPSLSPRASSELTH